jgi:hypothetical protein
MTKLLTRGLLLAVVTLGLGLSALPSFAAGTTHCLLGKKTTQACKMKRQCCTKTHIMACCKKSKGPKRV